MLAGYLLGLGFLAAPAVASAIDLSPVPRPRPVYQSISDAARLEDIPKRPPVFGPDEKTLRPRPRPPRASFSERSRPAGPVTSPVPAPRPPTRTRPVATAAGDPAIMPRSGIGRLCNDPDILGRKLAPIGAGTRHCGLPDPVEVVSVDGVALRPAAILNCDTARALESWVRGGLKPVIGRLGGGVRALQVADSFSCAPRNGEDGAGVLAHGQGSAVDIAAIELNDGGALSIARDWGNGPEGILLGRAHGAACGTFSTVLGPGAGAPQQEFLHLDMARNRTGAYCR